MKKIIFLNLIAILALFTDAGKRYMNIRELQVSILPCLKQKADWMTAN